MAEDRIATSDYWRRLLRLDEDGEEDALGKFRYPHRFLRPLFRVFFFFLCRFYFRLKVKGRENLPKKHPYIVAPNHCSAMDYPLVAFAMGPASRDLYVLATKFFYDFPLARFFMKIAANVQRIDIVDDFLPGLRVAAKILRKGKSIYINPEGTRSESGNLLPFRPGVGMLAAELNVPVVPVYIHGALEALPAGAPFPRPGNIEVNFGKPLLMDDYLPKLRSGNAYYVYREISEELKNRVQQLKNNY